MATTIQGLTMNYEQFNKHKEAIEWFYSKPNQQIWFLCNDNTWMLVQNPGWFIDNKYAINDDYSEFRKAKAEGKIIQFYNIALGKPHWVDWKGDITKEPIKSLRIKPEPTWKVGDWVQHPDGYAFQYTQGTLPTTYKPWKPNEGDWVWMWDTPELITKPAFCKLNSIVEGKFVDSDTIHHYKHCEPYLGQLPSIIKDKQC